MSPFPREGRKPIPIRLSAIEAASPRSGPEQDFAGNFATVNNLMLKKEGAVFTLKSGEIIPRPVQDDLRGPFLLATANLILPLQRN